MSYDDNGLGFAETLYVAMNMPEIFDTVTGSEESTSEQLKTIRKAIKAYEQGLIS